MFPLKLTRIKSILDYNCFIKSNITSAYNKKIYKKKMMFV